MRYLCDNCGELTRPGAFRVVDGHLELTCPRCGRLTIAPPEVAPAPVASPVRDVPVRDREGRPAGEVAPQPAAARASPKLAAVLPLASAPLDPERRYEAPEGVCPKCAAPRSPEALTCPRCGLTYDNFDPSLHELSGPLDAEWRALLTDRWREAEAHDRLLDRAVATGELEKVGRLYGLCLARRPHDELAIRGREEVLRRATAASFSLEPDSSGRAAALRRRRALLGAAAFILVMSLALLFLMLFG